MNRQRKILHSTPATVIAIVTITMAGLLPISPVFAGDDPSGPQRTVVQPLAHIDAEELAPVLELLGVQYVIKPSMNSIVIRGNPGYVDGALRAIQVLDEPVANITLTMFIVAASKDHADSQGIPDGLQPAVAQLRGVFGYSGFALLDAASLTVQSGRGGAIQGGVSLNGEEGSPSGYEITFDSARIAPADEELSKWMIRLDDLVFVLTDQRGAGLARIQTEVVVQEGQKAVIGRSTPRGIDDNLVLIVDARIEKTRRWARSDRR